MTRRKLFFFPLYDHTHIREYLERMAKKGWLLEKCGSLWWTYRSISPQKLKYCVTYVPQADYYEPGPVRQETELADLCGDTGWILAGRQAQMQIFYTADENPVPIETDALVQVETVHSAMKRGYLVSQWLLLAVSILQLFVQLGAGFSDSLQLLSSNSRLFAVIVYLFLFLITTTDLILYYDWRRKALAAAKEDNQFIPTRSTAPLQPFLVVFVLLLAAGYLLLLCTPPARSIMIGTLILLCLQQVVIRFLLRILKKAEMEAHISKTIVVLTTFAIMFIGVMWITHNTLDRFEEPSDASFTYEYHDRECICYRQDIPLRISDFTESDDEKYSFRLDDDKGSLLIKKITASQLPRLDARNCPELVYTLYSPCSPRLAKQCLQTLRTSDSVNYFLLGGKHAWESYEQTDPAPWGAKAAYHAVRDDRIEYAGSYSDSYLVYWEDAILILRFDGGLTDDSIARIAGKLHP